VVIAEWVFILLVSDCCGVHCVTSLAKALITASRHASTPRDRREYFLSRFSESRFISALEHELAFPADKSTDEKKRPRLAL
jgi:hypothetical protein